jgi:hypothetical protein
MLTYYRFKQQAEFVLWANQLKLISNDLTYLSKVVELNYEPDEVIDITVYWIYPGTDLNKSKAPYYRLVIDPGWSHNETISNLYELIKETK